jgi:hypothetical protein
MKKIYNAYHGVVILLALSGAAEVSSYTYHIHNTTSMPVTVETYRTAWWPAKVEIAPGASVDLDVGGWLQEKVVATARGVARQYLAEAASPRVGDADVFIMYQGAETFQPPRPTGMSDLEYRSFLGESLINQLEQRQRQSKLYIEVEGY